MPLRKRAVSSPSRSALLLVFAAALIGVRLEGAEKPDFTGSYTDAGSIADAFRSAIYADEPTEEYFGIDHRLFCGMLHSSQVVWAPDGDEAFDDGSYVLQFDVA